jgi:septal ring factor EnvC (AmiA/AmiB activator)
MLDLDAIKAHFGEKDPACEECQWFVDDNTTPKENGCCLYILDNARREVPKRQRQCNAYKAQAMLQEEVSRLRGHMTEIERQKQGLQSACAVYEETVQSLKSELSRVKADLEEAQDNHAVHHGNKYGRE